MNKINKRVATRFEPETKFAVKPSPPSPFRAVEETELERLKNRLLQNLNGSLFEIAMSFGFSRLLPGGSRT